MFTGTSVRPNIIKPISIVPSASYRLWINHRREDLLHLNEDNIVIKENRIIRHPEFVIETCKISWCKRKSCQQGPYSDICQNFNTDLYIMSDGTWMPFYKQRYYDIYGHLTHGPKDENKLEGFQKELASQGKKMHFLQQNPIQRPKPEATRLKSKKNTPEPAIKLKNKEYLVEYNKIVKLSPEDAILNGGATRNIIKIQEKRNANFAKLMNELLDKNKISNKNE